MDILTYSAAKAEAEKQRLLAEKYKAEVDDLKQQLQKLQQQMERAAATGLTMDKYLRMREHAFLQQETEYGRRMRLQKS